MISPQEGRGRSGRQSLRSLVQFLDETAWSGTWSTTAGSGRPKHPAPPHPPLGSFCITHFNPTVEVKVADWSLNEISESGMSY